MLTSLEVENFKRIRGRQRFISQLRSWSWTRGHRYLPWSPDPPAGHFARIVTGAAQVGPKQTPVSGRDLSELTLEGRRPLRLGCSGHPPARKIDPPFREIDLPPWCRPCRRHLISSNLYCEPMAPFGRTAKLT